MTYRLFAIAVCVGVVACRGEKPGPRHDSALVPPPTAAAPSWSVTERGIGPLQAGMTIAEAQQALGGRLLVPAKPDSECDYAAIRDEPVKVMLVEGHIARIDVDTGSIATAEGARVGDTEDRVKTLYGPRVVVTPHKYQEGSYLTVSGKTPADSAFAIVFETNGKTVTRLRSGKKPEVEFIEGCA
jgi:hypothetical protein